MALPPTPTGVIEFKLQHAALDMWPRFQQAYSSGPPGTGGLAAAATAVRVAYDSHLKALLNDGYSMDQVEAVDLANPSVPKGVDATAVVGTRAVAAPPLNVVACLNYLIDRRYRGSKPKTFWPWGGVADFGDVRSWGSGFVSAVNAAWTAFQAEINGEAAGAATIGEQVCVSFYSGTEPNPNPKGRLMNIPKQRTTPAVFAIMGPDCRTLFGSQRRRITES
jgi:hypothetical protein